MYSALVEKMMWGPALHYMIDINARKNVCIKYIYIMYSNSFSLFFIVLSITEVPL